MRFFSDRTIIPKLLDPSLDPEERNEVLDSRKILLKTVKRYIDEELNTTQINVVDPEKANYKPPPTIDKTLLKLDISKEDYNHALCTIWIFNQSSMSTKLLHTCVPIFQNLKISVHLP